jgi:hypothetical protein
MCWATNMAKFPPSKSGAMATHRPPRHPKVRRYGRFGRGHPALFLHEVYLVGSSVLSDKIWVFQTGGPI